MPEGERDAAIARGFDRLSPIYRGLTRLFPGDAIAGSQRRFFEEIADRRRALIVGGGSGEFLRALMESGFSGDVLNLDLSQGMLRRARRAIVALEGSERGRVTFRQAAVEGLDRDERFDLICTHYVLDLFPDDRLRDVVRRLDGCLEPQGLWWCSDFSPPAGSAVRRAAQQTLHRLLYGGFRLGCRIRAHRLPAIECVLEQEGYRPIRRESPAAGWLWTGLYRREVVKPTSLV